MSDQRPHWVLSEAVARGELSAAQREALAELVLNIGTLADSESHDFRGDRDLRASAWAMTVNDYDCLMGRLPPSSSTKTPVGSLAELPVCSSSHLSDIS